MKIGVVLPMGPDPQQRPPLPYREVRAMARQAEGDGFDSLWLYDHLLYRFPEQPTTGVWECWTFLSALAEATERCELGTIVICTAFRNPAVLAKMAATLDEVCGGRLILGLGAGWHQPEFDAFGLPFDHLAGRFEEAVKIIVPLLRDGAVDFTGQYSSAPNCAIEPRGPRPGGPDVLIAAKGPRMLRLTAEYADSWNAAWFGQPSLFLARRAELEAACREAGRDPAALQQTVGVSVAYPDLGDLPPGTDDPEKFLTGSAEEIAAGLRAYDDLGVAHVIANCVPNNRAALARFAEALALYRSGRGKDGAVA